MNEALTEKVAREQPNPFQTLAESPGVLVGLYRLSVNGSRHEPVSDLVIRIRKSDARLVTEHPDLAALFNQTQILFALESIVAIQVPNTEFIEQL